MKFMVVWKIPPGCYKAAVEKFLNTGVWHQIFCGHFGRFGKSCEVSAVNRLIH
jgi:hypothetical protein